MVGVRKLITRDLTIEFPGIEKVWDYNRNNVPPTTAGRNILQHGVKDSPIVYLICRFNHTRSIYLENLRPNNWKFCTECNDLSQIKTFTPLAITHPAWASKLDIEKSKITADELIPGANRVVWWKCSEYHTFSGIVKKVIANKETYCPVCDGRLFQQGVNDAETMLPALSNQWSPNNRPMSTVPVGSEEVFEWICQKDPLHIWKVSLEVRRAGSGCPICVHKIIIPGIKL